MALPRRRPSRRTNISRRPAVGLTVIALTGSSVVLGAVTANAAPTQSDSSQTSMPAAATGNSAAARYGAGYLARQILANGGYLAPFGSPDDGNTASAVVALTAAGVGGDAVKCAISYLKTRVATGLTDSTSADNAGALANVILAAVAAGENPRRFGGSAPANNLVSRLLATRHTSGADRGLFGASDPTYDGTYRQGLALAALKAVGVPSLRIAASQFWLERQQCANGLWTSYRVDTSVPCATADPSTFQGPDTNSTALAVEGLAAYGRTPKRATTLASLAGVQSSDGGFPFLAAKGQSSDPNSTAVVIQALVATDSSPSGYRWTKGGSNPYQALAAYQLGCGDAAVDRGAYFFPGSRTPDILATVQAVPAQVGATLPVSHRATTPGAPSLPC